MLDLEEIFEKQFELNTKTALRNPEYGKLTKDELTRNFVFAALVELGETANEWGEFKIWKKTRIQNREAICKKCNGGDIEDCIHCFDGTVDPLLEEYIDVFHFVVSVAIGLNLNEELYMLLAEEEAIENARMYKAYDEYLGLYEKLINVNKLLKQSIEGTLRVEDKKENELEREVAAFLLMDALLGLGYSLGFTDEEIYEAYFSKHKINHKRQESNY